MKFWIKRDSASGSQFWLSEHGRDSGLHVLHDGGLLCSIGYGF